MAFPPFPKSGKKAAGRRVKHEATPPPEDPRPRIVRPVASAREVAASVKGHPRIPSSPMPVPSVLDPREVTVTGPTSLINLSGAGDQGIEVAEANPGLCAVLENAALLYANGQSA